MLVKYLNKRTIKVGLKWFAMQSILSKLSVLVFSFSFKNALP